MEGWQLKTIGEVATLQRGIDITRAEQNAGSVPVVSSSGISSFHDIAAAKGPGVILGRKGVVGSVFFISSDYWPHDTSLWVKDFHNNDQRFVYYFFLSISAKLRNLDVGSANPTLNRNHVHPLLVPWPSSIAEQQGISAVLAALDDKIELNRRMNETLETSARALFRDWFVDFGPTRAKAEGRPAYLDPDLWSLFPERLGDGGVPEGWKRFAVGDIAEQRTSTISPMATGEELFEHYSLPAYDAGGSPVRDQGSGIKSNKTLVPTGTVLLSKLNPEISRVWLPDNVTGERQVASTEFLAYVPKKPASRSLLFALFRDDTFRQTLEGMVTGTSKSHQRVSPPALRAVEAITGSAPVFAAFDRVVASMIEQTLRNRAEVRTLATTRDALLPKLMSGELWVREAEALVAA